MLIGDIMNIKIYFLLFIIYSFIGWIMEVIYTKFKDGNWVNRGFLLGTICPIYGSGCVLMLLLLNRYKNDLFILFFMAIVICSILEYLTSFILEKLFNARWWDYSDRKLNINGRICLETMLPFGILGCLLVKYINPFVLRLLNKIPVKTSNAIAIILLILLIIDIVLSFSIIGKLKESSEKILKKARKKDSTEEVSRKVREYILNYSKYGKRLILSFPHAKILIEKYRSKRK